MIYNSSISIYCIYRIFNPQTPRSVFQPHASEPPEFQAMMVPVGDLPPGAERSIPGAPRSFVVAFSCRTEKVAEFDWVYGRYN
jgi:hypothetical protein